MCTRILTNRMRVLFYGGNMKRIAGIAAAVVLFLAAMVLTLYPLISDYVNTKYQSEI